VSIFIVIASLQSRFDGRSDEQLARTIRAPRAVQQSPLVPRTVVSARPRANVTSSLSPGCNERLSRTTSPDAVRAML
jgi:hypothetical protein